MKSQKLRPPSLSISEVLVSLTVKNTLKKQKVPESFSERDLDERILKQQQEEEERKRQRRESKKEKKKEKAAINEAEEIDPEVAEMMGFGGFRSSNK